MNVKQKMRNFLIWLQGLFHKTPQNPEVKVVLSMMAMTFDQELSCDEVHALIDQFAEMQMRGEDPARLFPLIQRHLEMCPECREEFEALLAALQVIPASR
jgi:hypothetical protein